MKKILAMFVTLSLGLMLVSAAVAGVSSLNLQETSLAPSGEAYEVNLGSDGLLYVSDYLASQIWRVDPANPQVDKYQFVINVSDAHPDSAGNIWFTDGDTTFARLDPVTNQAVYWDVPEGRYLQGLTFDPAGKLWMTEYFGFASKVYSFDMSSTELCTYTLPLDGDHAGSSQSFYILSEQDQLWIANRGEHRIYRLDSTLDQATWWQIPDETSRPTGITLDSLGNLWWADEGLGALASLNPVTNIMTRYNLPNSAQPQMIVLLNDVVWYTAAANGGLGYLGILHPEQAGGTPVELDRQTYPASNQCYPNWGAGTSLYVSHTTPTPSWSNNNLTTIINTDAWQVFQLPDGSSPYGINYDSDKIWATDQLRKKLMQVPLNQASIIVDKVVVNDNGGSAAPNDFQLTLGGTPVLDEIAVIVTPGTYTAGETLLPGYSFVGFSGDCDSNGNVTVALGETKTCILTNDDQQAYIIVDKVVINDNGGSAEPDDFALTLDGSPVLDGVAVPVDPGSYTAGETQLPGYSFTGFSGACDINGVVTVALSETKTCILTNDDQPANIGYSIYLPFIER